MTEAASEAASEAAWEALMDAMQVVITLKAGQVLTQADVDAVHLVDAYNREDQERAIDVFNTGFQRGMEAGGGADKADLINKLDAARSGLAVEKALGKFNDQRGFRRGAQACREMLARFVEQGGDATTAASLRANWNPEWGDDPGQPTSAQAGNQSPPTESPQSPNAEELAEPTVRQKPFKQGCEGAKP